MALLGKRNVNNAGIPWPNPYNLTKADATGKLEDTPLEVITLILKEMELQGVSNALKQAQIIGISSEHVLDWNKTKDGTKFWSDIWYASMYDVFYKKYTPEILSKRLREK